VASPPASSRPCGCFPWRSSWRRASSPTRRCSPTRRASALCGRREPTLQNYRDVFERVAFGRIFLNSLLVNGAIVAGGLVVNSLAGYALARLRFPGRQLLLAGVLALLVIPLEAIAVPLFYELTALGGRDTYWVQIAPFVANALSVYLFYSFFLGLPHEIEDAARVDGAGPLRIYLEIVAPAARPAFVAVAIVTFLMHWGLYLWPLLMTSSVEVRPLPSGWPPSGRSHRSSGET
jgi:multiple sugar transport system permease protein